LVSAGPFTDSVSILKLVFDKGADALSALFSAAGS
jgi:hypothetical protein